MKEDVPEHAGDTQNFVKIDCDIYRRTKKFRNVSKKFESKKSITKLNIKY